jgi:hypothetical protein
MKISLLFLLLSFSLFAEEKPPVIPQFVVDHHVAACPEYATEYGKNYMKGVYTLPESEYSKQKNTLYVLGCEMYAYNSQERAYIVDPKGNITDVYVAEINFKGELTATNSLMGSDYDEANQALYTFQKGRGIGDCGSASTYIYSPYEEKFILKEARIKENCDGDMESEWPVVYSK